MGHHILVLDDDKNMGDLVQDYLHNKVYRVQTLTNPLQSFQIIEKENFDCILTDIQMPEMNGLEFCETIKRKFPDLPVIVMTAFGSLDVAINAIKVGAYDFVTKPVEMETLKISIDRALEHSSLKKQLKKLSCQLEHLDGYGDIVGNSEPMKNLFHLMERIGSADISVLIRGETGTGKELVAKALHKQSLYKSGPFVTVNCAALPEHLLESELFGHVKGAFTGAQHTRKGLFLEATEGTLFLDEIGDLPLDLQSKLLRVLEDKKIRHVGSDTELPVNFRLISATSRDLESKMEEKTYREDLYFRLATMVVELPSLRARGNDILLLAKQFMDKKARHFNKDVNRINEMAAKHLLNYPWKGNVRELRNIMERAVVLSNGPEITPADLPDKVTGYHPGSPNFLPENPHELISLQDLEKKYIKHVMTILNGNHSRASKILAIDRKTLYRKLD